MAECSTVTKTLRDGVITILDAAGTGQLTYTVIYENGDFSGTFPKADRVVIRDRHSISGLRKGANPIPTFSFSVHMQQFTDGTDDTIIDVVEKTGSWASATTTGGAGFEEFLCKVVLTVEGTDFSDAADHALTLNDCLLTWDFAEGDPNTINVSGEVYGTVSRTGPS